MSAYEHFLETTFSRDEIFRRSEDGQRQTFMVYDLNDAREANDITYAHMATLCVTRNNEICVAFQCSCLGAEGSPGQHIRFSTSKDDGKTWSETSVPMYGLAPLWSPVLHSRKNEVWMFYSESRKQLSPGGDVKLIKSDDLGENWTCPRTVLTHEAYHGVPKVIANSICEIPLGREGKKRMFLPFWTEACDMWLRYKDYHPLQENETIARKKVYRKAPKGGRDDEDVGFCACLFCDDVNGDAWHAPELNSDCVIRYPESTWLIENSLFYDDRTEKMTMYLRSGLGRIWRAEGLNDEKLGIRWDFTSVRQTSLPNPNSKIATEKITITVNDSEDVQNELLAMNL